jgi:hypothetical protein
MKFRNEFDPHGTYSSEGEGEEDKEGVALRGYVGTPTSSFYKGWAENFDRMLDKALDVYMNSN